NNLAGRFLLKKYRSLNKETLNQTPKSIERFAPIVKKKRRQSLSACDISGIRTKNQERLLNYSANNFLSARI
ncbi:MAG: hypothetical protein KAG28_09635, partial [Cocleimonas sp.]|nr:hypothetical protein [Cocleimonas sp.]